MGRFAAVFAAAAVAEKAKSEMLREKRELEKDA